MLYYYVLLEAKSKYRQTQAAETEREKVHFELVSIRIVRIVIAIVVMYSRGEKA